MSETFALLPADHPALRPSTDLAVTRATIDAAELSGDAPHAHRRSILDFLATHPDALERSCAEGHLTGSALVVDSSGSHTLLMLHRKLGRWFQPGGHADGDANLAHVALREAEEETGLTELRIAVPAIDVDIHSVEPPGEPPHLHLDVRFLVVAPPDAVEVANEESLALRWVVETDLAALGADPGTRRLVHRGIEVGRELGLDSFGEE